MPYSRARDDTPPVSKIEGVELEPDSLLVWLRCSLESGTWSRVLRRNSETVRSVNGVVDRTTDAAATGSWLGD